MKGCANAIKCQNLVNISIMTIIVSFPSDLGKPFMKFLVLVEVATILPGTS